MTTATQTASPPSPTTEQPLVRAERLSVRYVTQRSLVRARPIRQLTAVDALSLEVPRGQTYGLVGESGSGKSSAGRALLRLEDAAEGSLIFDGVDITTVRGAALRALRRRMQMVFQDPMGSLNPRETIESIVSAPLRVNGIDRDRARVRARMLQTLDLVGLSASAADRYAHEFSGGQRQRIGIARAIIARPDFIVADEPVSALDVSVQAQIVNLLLDVQRELGLTTVLIAHDLAVVRQMSDTIGVMYLGALVEEGSADDIHAAPLHPYTQALLSAAPIPDPHVEDERERIVLRGDLPSPSVVTKGCRFASRCPQRRNTRCDDERPELRLVAPGRRVACHWVEPTGAHAGHGPRAVDG